MGLSPDAEERLAASIEIMGEIDPLELGERPGELLEVRRSQAEYDDVTLVGLLLERKEQLVLDPFRLR